MKSEKKSYRRLQHMAEDQTVYLNRGVTSNADLSFQKGNPDSHSSSTVLPDVYNEDATLSMPKSATQTYLSNSFRAALLLTNSIFPVPLIALIITVSIYISPWKSLFSILNYPPVVVIIGLAISIIFWFCLSLLFIRTTTMNSMNPVSSNHVRSHLLSLKAAFTTVKLAHTVYKSTPFMEKDPIVALREGCTYYYDSAAEEVSTYLKEIDQELRRGGSRWVNGSGYLNAWNFIHLAEEAMIDIAPVEEVIKEALHDELSIEGSDIGGRDDILNKLRIAVSELSPTAGIYLKPPTMPTTKISSSNYTDKTKAPDAKEEMEARNAIRNVKLILNEFRDALWNALILSRNRLTVIALIMGVLSYLLLSAAILLGASAPAMGAAMIYYLVGAIVGLFGRLYAESQTVTNIDDYGLTVARLIVTPILSGLAALAGVLIVAMLVAMFQNQHLPILVDIYSLDQNLRGLIIAAVFGWTPNLLVNLLQKKTDEYKTQLKKSSPSTQVKA
jgi:phosphate/sulfate permease